MTTQSSERGLGLADIERWRASGLITAEQAEAMRRDLEGRAAEPAGRPRGRLNLPTIATYFGVFMILLAYTIFVGREWESLGQSARLMVAAATVAVLLAAGWALRRVDATAGNLLVTAAAGVAPLLAQTLLDVLLWRAVDPYNTYLWHMAIVYGAGLAAALAALWLTRFPLAALLAVAWGWLAVTSALLLATGQRYWDWNDGAREIGALCGLATLAAGWLLQRRGGGRYAFWVYLGGHLLLLVHLGVLALDAEGAYALLFPALYLGFVAASAWLRQRVFLVFGALGVFGYLCYLAFDVFEGALGFTFGLAAVGLVTVLGAVGLRRLMRQQP